MTTMLLHLDYLHVHAPDGHETFGFDQEWYGQLWRRRAGCGPTTVANLLTYLHRAGQLILPDAIDPAKPLELMNFCWNYVTPTMRGLNTPQLFRDGANRLLKAIGSKLRAHMLVVDKDASLRPTAAQTAAFVRAGLAAQSPVAFLNLCNGQEQQLDAWHWVTVLGMEESNTCTLHILDNTVQLRVDLPLWLATTTRGGGFVYLAKEER
jgi:hypothetical protein